MRAIPFLLLALLLASCSKRKEEAQSLVHEIPVQSFRAALQMAESARIHCADPSACPENVGLFVSASDSSVATCTAFLIESDIVATNSHCVPSAVKMMPDLCSERIRAVFPGSAERGEESLSCESLLGFSERPNSISPDLALFRVKPSGRKALATNPQGVKPNAIHRTFKMNPSEGASGTLVAQECFSVPNSYRFPLYRGESDPVFVIGDCASIPGNSGAPLLNQAGEAVGVLQAELALEQEQKNAWEPYLEENASFAPLAIGTSLLCRQSQGWSWNPTCAPIDEQEIVRPNIRDFLANLEPRLHAAARAFGHQIFQWKPVLKRRLLLENEYSLEPECIQPLEGWIGDYLILANPLLFEEEARFTIPLPRLKAAMRFNRYTQVSAAVSFKENEERPFTIHPQRLAITGADGDLHLCPATE